MDIRQYLLNTRLKSYQSSSALLGIQYINWLRTAKRRSYEVLQLRHQFALYFSVGMFIELVYRHGYDSILTERLGLTSNSIFRISLRPFLLLRSAQSGSPWRDAPR